MSATKDSFIRRMRKKKRAPAGALSLSVLAKNLNQTFTRGVMPSTNAVAPANLSRPIGWPEPNGPHRFKIPVRFAPVNEHPDIKMSWKDAIDLFEQEFKEGRVPKGRKLHVGDVMPIAVHRLVRLLTKDARGESVQFGFNVYQLGKYIVTVDSMINESEHIPIGWAHNTHLWGIVCSIIAFARRNDLFSFSMEEEAELMRDYEVDEDEPAIKKAMKEEAWNQPFWGGAMKDVHKARELSRNDIPLFQESGLTGRLELMFNDLPAIASGNNLIYGFFKRTQDTDEYSDMESYHDRQINAIYWGLDSRILDERTDERLNNLGDNTTIVASVDKYVIDNGRVVKTHNGEYEKRREARRTIKDLMEWLEKEKPHLG